MAKKNSPDGVVVSDNSVKILKNITNLALLKVLDTLTIDITRKVAQSKVKDRITNIEQEARNRAVDWIRVVVPAFYLTGMKRASDRLLSRGSNIAVTSDFTTQHRQNIEAISSQTFLELSEGMSGISRTGFQILDRATQESIIQKIARGVLGSNTRRDISKSVIKELRQNGVTALRDRRGAAWSLERYSEMLARTKLTQVHNTGLTSRMLESGYDLIRISDHLTSCPLCQPFQGQILSLNGRTRGYTTLDQAKAQGLFHPNCRHTFSPIESRFLDVAKIWSPEKQKYVDFRPKGRPLTKDTMHKRIAKKVGIENVDGLGDALERSNKAAVKEFHGKMKEDKFKNALGRLLPFL